MKKDAVKLGDKLYDGELVLVGKFLCYLQF